MPARTTKSSSASGGTSAPRTRRPAASKASKTSKSTAAAAAAAENPAPAPSPPPPGPAASPLYTPLQTAVSTVFASAQRTTAGHRKLATQLRTIQEQCIASRGVGVNLGGRAGEKAFGKEFIRNLNKVLMVKKSEVVGDRCLRFCELFVRGAVEKDETIKKPKPPGEGDEEEEQEEEIPNGEQSPTTRFVISLLKYLTPFLTSKEKTVRYRTVQFLGLLLTSAIMHFPYETEAEVFKRLRIELSRRLYDKEAAVRMQAAVCLIRLLEMGMDGLEDDEETDDEDLKDDQGRRAGLIAIIIGALQNDPSADVRRIILYNLSPTQQTLPYLLERTRDVDNPTRRSVFTRLLPSLGDFRHLSINMREKLLRWGLRDRDEAVRNAASKMFNYRWMDDAKGDIIEVLERMHVVGNADGVVELAMKGFWDGRKDMVESLRLEDGFWEEITPEGAFLARSFNDWCRNPKHKGKYEGLLEKLPEATKLAYHAQEQLNKLIRMLAADEEGGQKEDEAETDTTEQEFIVEQLLMIARTMDYGDEVGRRKMFQLMRDSLLIVELPEGITKLAVQCLARLTLGETDFCVLIFELLAELRDRAGDDEEEEEGSDSDDDDDLIELRDDDDDAADQLKMEAGGHVQKKVKMSAGKAAETPKKGTPAPAEKSKKGTPSTAAAAKGDKNKTKKKKHPDAMDVDSDDDDEDEGEEDEGNSDSEDEIDKKALFAVVIDIKRLHIAQHLLENVSGNLTQNTHLVHLLNGLIVPAVRSHEAMVRELGLRCLGLSCLLDRTLAVENLTLFAHVFNKGHESMQVAALHVISDMLMVHGEGIFEESGSGTAAAPGGGLEKKMLFRLLGKALKLEDNNEVQAAAAEVTCKLMLAQVIRDEDLLKALVICYFDPSTRDNLSLRQILSYFFPVYCHSRSENQVRMQEVAIQIIHTLHAAYDSLDADEEMVSPTLIATHIVDWTDPRKQVGYVTYLAQGGGAAVAGGRSTSPPPFTSLLAKKPELPPVNLSVHALLAGKVLERITGSCPKEERKILIGMLGKLWIPKEAGRDELRRVYEGVARALEKKVAIDAAGRATLSKVEVAVGRVVALWEEEEEEERERERVGGGKEGGEEGGEEEEGEDAEPEEPEEDAKVKEEDEEDEVMGEEEED